jgi:hypothetical protein
MQEPVGGSLSKTPARIPSGFQAKKTLIRKLKPQMNTAPKPFPKKIVLRFFIELVIYAMLVSIYLALILTFFVGWLKGLFLQHPVTYAFVSIILMILQAVGLEKLTAILIHVNRRRQG